MRILWLSHFVPFPPKGGCFQRSYNLIRQVGAHHDVHLVALRHKQSTHPANETRDARDALLRHCREVEILDIASPHVGLTAAAALLTAQPLSVRVYRSKAFRHRVRQLCAQQRFDVAHLDTIGLAQYLDELRGLPSVITHHGAESHMMRRRIPYEPNVLKKLYCMYESLTLRAYERQICPRVSANVVVSEDDARILSAIAAGATFEPVDNGVDTSFFAPEPRQPGRRLIFAGRLDQYSNRHGILKFMREVWPELHQRFPDLSIDIIGHRPPLALRKMASDRVTVHGFVSDLRQLFAQATVAVCPLWDGGGTRLKVLDTLALGTPLVSTAIGCEGLQVEHERDALLVESSEDFTNQIARLLDDRALQSRLSANGRLLVERHYSWEVIAPRLIRLYQAASAPQS